MLESIARIRRVTHPAPAFLVPFALGAPDPATAGHVASCAACQGEVERLREAAGLLRAPTWLERRIETPDCLDELVVADLVEGRLGAEARAPVVAHLLTCPRCRTLVKATAEVAARMPAAVESRGRAWRRWTVPLGVAAAAALLVVLLPHRGDDGSTGGLREPPLTSTVAPAPIAPRATVTRVNRFIWSSVPHAERYRLRLYDGEGTVAWRTETTDTVAVLPDSVALSPGVSYFWRVEAETEWRRWAGSDLIEFRLAGPHR
ncbi:MAG TPA: hypothetical protein VEK86_15125 [Gemmatimonadales bacterium]|nr:hypothetical protein [Gemmatimonadales bacterium]